MPRSDDVIARWLAFKEERGRLPSTLQQYRWVARTALDALGRAGRPTAPRKWAPQDARWLFKRFKEDRWRLGILANLARFSRNPVFNDVDLPRPRRRYRARGPSGSRLRALLGVDEQRRRPKLVVLVGLDRGPHRTEWLQLPAEYIDLAGNRRLLRSKGPGNPIVVVPEKPRKERIKELLRDDRVRRWHRGLRLENPETAARQLQCLSRLLDGVGLSVAEAIHLGRYEPAKLEVILYQWVEKRKKEGRQVSYLKNTVGTLRTLFEKERVPFYNWPKLRRRGAPTLASERVPTSLELHRICAVLEPRWRAAALLIAQSGLRPGVLCRNDARNCVKALQLKHIPDLKLKRRRHFERIPFRIDVPAELSKTGQSYLTFGGQEAADALLAYLNERTKPVIDQNGRVVKRHRERLSPESYVIAGMVAGKQRAHAGDQVDEYVLSAAIRRGIRKVQPEGVRWRPYVLRDYCSTRLFLAECRGLILRDVREYLLGHNTGVSGRYNLGKRLGEEVINEMRSMYVKSLPFLETPRTVRDVENLRRVKWKPPESPPTGILTAKEKERFPGLTDAEFVDELSRGLRGIEDETPRQQVVPIAEGRRLVKQGWQFVARFGPGEVVVRSS